MRLLNLGHLKAGLRKFLARSASTSATINWDPSTGLIEVVLDSGRKMKLIFPPDALNSEGDYMTDEEKQNFADALIAIADEHNNQI